MTAPTRGAPGLRTRHDRPTPLTGIRDPGGCHRFRRHGKSADHRHNHRFLSNVAVDTKGLSVMIIITPAGMTDRDAARKMPFRLPLTHPQLTQVWADSAYAGRLVDWAHLQQTLRTVARPKDAKGFVVLPRRWKIERTLGWIMRARRNVRDYQRLPQHSEARCPQCPHRWCALAGAHHLSSCLCCLFSSDPSPFSAVAAGPSRLRTSPWPLPSARFLVTEIPGAMSRGRDLVRAVHAW
ncbi:transposase [Streptomyces sp. NPDC003710]